MAAKVGSSFLPMSRMLVTWRPGTMTRSAGRFIFEQAPDELRALLEDRRKEPLGLGADDEHGRRVGADEARGIRVEPVVGRRVRACVMALGEAGLELADGRLRQRLFERREHAAHRDDAGQIPGRDADAGEVLRIRAEHRRQLAAGAVAEEKEPRRVDAGNSADAWRRWPGPRPALRTRIRRE